MLKEKQASYSRRLKAVAEESNGDSKTDSVTLNGTETTPNEPSQGQSEAEGHPEGQQETSADVENVEANGNPENEDVETPESESHQEPKADNDIEGQTSKGLEGQDVNSNEQSDNGVHINGEVENGEDEGIKVKDNESDNARSGHVVEDIVQGQIEVPHQGQGDKDKNA